MKRAPILACLGFTLVCGIAPPYVFTQASSAGKPMRGMVRVDETNLPYEVRIAPTAMKAESTSIETGGDTWNARGFDLKTLLAQVFDMDARRIDVGADGGEDSLANQRYDVELSLPVEVDQQTMERVLADALRRKFGLTITAENRTMSVYVLRAPNGAGAELHRHVFAHAKNERLAGLDSDGDAGRITYMGKDCSGVSSGGISVSGGTISDFSRTLEPDLDRVLIDETNLSGSYDFQIGNYGNQQELFQLLHDRLGLVMTPEQRKVTVLAVRPAAAQSREQGSDLRAAL